ncbi:MAG: cupin domain-containing protein [Nitriliruptoraceae bacterium]
MSEQARDEVDIIALARASDDFRRVVMTGQHMQIVTMTLPPGEEIGAETHEGHDQVLLFVEGTGEAVLDGERSTVSSGDLVFVYAGVLHNFINTGDEPLRLVTAYAPPEHEHGTRHATKDEAQHDH